MEKIPEDDYKKAIFQVRGQLTAIWNFARCYGLQNDVDHAIEETVQVIEQFGERVRGKDSPILVRLKPTRRHTE